MGISPVTFPSAAVSLSLIVPFATVPFCSIDVTFSLSNVTFPSGSIVTFSPQDVVTFSYIDVPFAASVGSTDVNVSLAEKLPDPVALAENSAVV